MREGGREGKREEEGRRDREEVREKGRGRWRENQASATCVVPRSQLHWRENRKRDALGPTRDLQRVHSGFGRSPANSSQMEVRCVHIRN